MRHFKRKLPETFAKLTLNMAIAFFSTITSPLHAEESNPGKIQANQRLSPAEKVRLISLLSEQMTGCINYKDAAPKIFPQITFELGLDGAITVEPELKNSSSEATFQPFANSIISALRRCQPYRIPSHFHATHAEWKNILIQVDTSVLQDPPKPPKR